MSDTDSPAEAEVAPAEAPSPTIVPDVAGGPPTAAEAVCVAAMRSGLAAAGVAPAPEDAGFLTDATFLRFCRARDADPAKATAMLQAALIWRAEYKPWAVTPADVAGILALRTVFLCGRCKAGRPVMYMTPGATNPYPAEIRTKLMVFLLEETQRAGFERLTWVFDWSAFGKRAKDDESSKTRQAVTKVLQDYYPERLGALFMVATPWYFSAVYAVASLFIDPRTTRKIHIRVKQQELTRWIDESELIESLGGKRPLPVAWTPPGGTAAAAAVAVAQ